MEFDHVQPTVWSPVHLPRRPIAVHFNSGRGNGCPAIERAADQPQAWSISTRTFKVFYAITPSLTMPMSYRRERPV